MTPKDLTIIREIVENEGFDYALVHYSDFEDIEDRTFHALRQEFLDARDALANYCDIDGDAV